uniref:Beta-defensin 12 n=1 Tax=Chrysolophus pictus TaxID=9089 RepID=A0A3G1B4T2_CHRPC|nr:beta-defensin 12 [Chrysolophus pictus]
MGNLCFMFIFISLLAHGKAGGSTHGPDSCNHDGGLCRVGSCIPGEYLAKYCFEPVILCCKPLSPTATKS